MRIAKRLRDSMIVTMTKIEQGDENLECYEVWPLEGLGLVDFQDGSVLRLSQAGIVWLDAARSEQARERAARNKRANARARARACAARSIGLVRCRNGQWE